LDGVSRRVNCHKGNLEQGFARVRCDNCKEACTKVGLPLMFHMDRRNPDEKGLPRLENVLKLYPACTIIAHSDWWKHLSDGTCVVAQAAEQVVFSESDR